MASFPRRGGVIQGNRKQRRVCVEHMLLCSQLDCHMQTIELYDQPAQCMRNEPLYVQRFERKTAGDRAPYGSQDARTNKRETRAVEQQRRRQQHQLQIQNTATADCLFAARFLQVSTPCKNHYMLSAPLPPPISPHCAEVCSYADTQT